MSDPNQQLITSRLGISTIFRTMIAQNTLLHMHVTGYEQGIVTTLLAADANASTFIVDASSDALFNKHLTRPGNIHFSASVDKIRIRFSVTGPANRELFDGKDAYKLPFPESLSRLQRRNHYRIDIPISNPLIVEAIPKTGKLAKLKAKDLSLGGIALFDTESTLVDAQPDTLYKQCVLHLDEVGAVEVDLLVRRVSNDNKMPGKETRIIACEFSGLKPSSSIMIQNYLGRLERMLNARRRGFD